MSKDERLAEKSWESKGMWYNVSADHYSYVDGFLEGLKAGKDKAIKELEAQIEKMKCCTNCEFLFIDGNCYYDKECKNKDHWKLMR